MNLIPRTVSRFGHRSILKLNASSPTLLVVAGVVGLGATAVLAAKATRKIDPILEQHKSVRAEIGYIGNSREQQKDLVKLYSITGLELTKLYGPALFVGTASAVAVLGGHNILRQRQIATLAAYSGLFEQFQAYRGRVAKTLGEDVERGIYAGAHGEWEEDPNHKGEYKLMPHFDPLMDPDTYLRPWFDEKNPNFKNDPQATYLFLKGVQSHMNDKLQVRGHLFLNEVYDALGMDRVPAGQIGGWVWNSKVGDNYVDLGFMSQMDPDTVAFREGRTREVRLNFNIDGPVWDLIGRRSQ